MKFSAKDLCLIMALGLLGACDVSREVAKSSGTQDSEIPESSDKADSDKETETEKEGDSNSDVSAPPLAGNDSDCTCSNPVLAAGKIPTPNDVGSCAPFTKNFTGDVEITDAWLKANNGDSKVVRDISAKGTIHIMTDGVKICNFEAKTIKVVTGTENAVVQDGDFTSTEAGLFIIFQPESSGLFRRIYGIGGTSDAIRVSKTAAGGAAIVEQSYFKDIAKYREMGAHADFVQTFPQLDDGDYHRSIIRQNYFSTVYFKGKDCPAVNAVWMGMRPGAEFTDNLVDYVHRGFWIDGGKSGKTTHVIKNNVFNDIENYQKLECGQPGLSHSNNIGPRTTDDKEEIIDISDCSDPRNQKD